MRTDSTGVNGRIVGAVALSGLLALAGCGGGSGGGTTGGGSGSSGSGGSTTTNVSVGPFAITPSTASPTLASGTTPSYNSAIALPTSFPLTESVQQVSSTSVSDSSANSGNATLTLLGVIVNGQLNTNGPVLGTYAYQLNVPGLTALNSDSKNVLPHDGTVVTLSDGSTAALHTTDLTYTQFGIWNYTAKGSSTTYVGTLVTGYQTPTSGVPTSGTGTYSGPNDVGGTVYAPSNSAVSPASLSGSVSGTVNFATGAVSAQLTGMTASAAGSSGSTAWNQVNLTGTLSGATFKGTTTTPAAVSGTYGMSAGATGTFAGALYGPNGNELGAIWSLNETGGSTNGKAAVGTFGAVKTN
jgi:hypothetical protein